MLPELTKLDGRPSHRLDQCSRRCATRSVNYARHHSLEFCASALPRNAVLPVRLLEFRHGLGEEVCLSEFDGRRRLQDLNLVAVADTPRDHRCRQNLRIGDLDLPPVQSDRRDGLVGMRLGNPLVVVLLALMLQQLGLAGILLVAGVARVRYRSHISDWGRKRGIRKPRKVGEVLFAGASRQIRTWVVLEYVCLTLGTGFVDFLTVLAVVISLRPEDRKIQFGDRLHALVGVTLGEMVDEHATSFEPQKTVVTLVDEALVVRRRNLGNKCKLTIIPEIESYSQTEAHIRMKHLK